MAREGGDAVEAGSSPPAPRASVHGVLWLFPVVLLWAAVHGHALTLSFISDDFEWWQHARMALERPALLLAPYGGFRPVNTWTFAVDYLLWGAEPAGYHLTNLLLHLACGVLLWLLLGRERFSSPARAATAALWLCSPFTAETATYVQGRYEPVMLMVWLGLALLWPRPNERWSVARTAAAVALAALAVCTKESWVVLPGFVLAYDLLLARAPFRRALARTCIAGAAVAGYLLVYFRAPAIAPESFFGAGAAGTLKVPHAWAAFAGLAKVRPMEFGFGAAEAIAVVTILLLAWFGWRRDSRLIVAGLAVFALPFVPILPVGWMPARYMMTPFAGFLVAVAAALREGVTALAPRRRVAARIAIGGAAALLLTANLVRLHGDRADAGALSAVHERLVDQARAFAPRYPRDRVVVAVRLERGEPLREVSRTLAGIDKVFYVRPADPGGLAEWSALLSYALDPLGGPLLARVDVGSAPAGAFTVVAYTEAGFVEREPLAVTVAGECEAWRARGVTARVLVPWR